MGGNGKGDGGTLKTEHLNKVHRPSCCDMYGLTKTPSGNTGGAIPSGRITARKDEKSPPCVTAQNGEGKGVNV